MANAALMVDTYSKKDTSQWRIHDLTLGGVDFVNEGGSSKVVLTPEVSFILTCFGSISIKIRL